MALEKRIKLIHGVTELGNLQVYQCTEILEDGNVIDSKRSKPYTPADINNIDDFDQKSKDIVAAITTKEAKDEFKAAKQEKTGTGMEKIITYDRIVEESGCVAVRQIIRIFDEGKEISKKYHRSWINPGDDPSGNDAMSKAVAKKLHTQEVITAYKSK